MGLPASRGETWFLDMVIPYLELDPFFSGSRSLDFRDISVNDMVIIPSIWDISLVVGLEKSKTILWACA